MDELITIYNNAPQEENMKFFAAIIGLYGVFKIMKYFGFFTLESEIFGMFSYKLDSNPYYNRGLLSKLYEIKEIIFFIFICFLLILVTFFGDSSILKKILPENENNNINMERINSMKNINSFEEYKEYNKKYGYTGIDKNIEKITDDMAKDIFKDKKNGENEIEKNNYKIKNFLLEKK